MPREETGEETEALRSKSSVAIAISAAAVGFPAVCAQPPRRSGPEDQFMSMKFLY